MKTIQFFAYCLLAAILFSACRGTKKITTAISKKDTAVVVIIPQNKVDSADIIKNILARVNANHIDVQWFNAKMKVDYEDNSGKNTDFTANIRIRRDSLIWIQVTGLLGIEGFRIMITKDSVKLMNKLKKEIQYRSIAYLQDLTQLPFDYHTLQDLLLGNPIYFSNKISSYKQSDNQLFIQSTGPLFKHLITLDTATNDILHSKLDDADVTRNRTAEITFDDFDKGKGTAFSKDRRLTVTEKSKLDIHMDFKQYDFDQAQTFPFNVPKNYKVK